MTAAATTTATGDAATKSRESDPAPPSNITTQEQQQQQQLLQHTSIVLFYRYFLPDDDDDVKEGRSSLPAPLIIQQYPDIYLPKLQQFAKDLCLELHLKGRILIAAEGINGTVSASSPDVLQQFMDQMEAFDLVRDLGPRLAAADDDDAVLPTPTKQSERLFQGIDWKLSSTVTSTHTDSGSSSSPAPAHNIILEPFPDLKVSIVKEIISTGGAVSVKDVQTNGGTHLTPQEFHQILLESSSSSSDNNNNNDHNGVVLIDVRNTFEHAIGHFVQPDGTPAINPETVTFSSFDATFCAANAEALQNRKVLLYCTVRVCNE